MIYYFTFIFFLLFIITCCVSVVTRRTPKILNSTAFPQIIILHDKKSTIVKELEHFRESNRWTRWKQIDIINNIEQLEKMSFDDIIKYINTDINYLNMGIPSYRVLWIRLGSKLITENAFYAPVTSLEIMNIKELNMINYGVSCIEKNTSVKFANKNKNIIKCYFPLQIPDGDLITIKTSSKEYDMKTISLNTSYLVLSDDLEHEIINSSGQNAFFIVIDFTLNN